MAERIDKALVARLRQRLERVNQLGETMVESSNQIAHMYHDGVVYSL